MTNESEPIKRDILVPRSSGRIEVWTNTGEADQDGNPILRSQTEEYHKGKLQFVQKSANPQFLSNEIQDRYAHELGMDRPTLTAEQLDGNFEAEGLLDAQKDLGKVSLDAVKVESPDAAFKPKETTEVHDSIAVDALVDTLTDIMAQVRAGLIKNSDGQPYSESEMLGIFKDFVEEADHPTVAGFDITKLIPRSGGIRDIVRGAMGYGRAAALKEAIAIISAKPSEQPKVINSPVSNPGVIEQPISSVELPAQETDRQMYERQIREYADELQDLYAELRTYAPKSDDAYRVEKQIRENKEDSGRVAAKLRRL